MRKTRSRASKEWTTRLKCFLFRRVTTKSAGHSFGRSMDSRACSAMPKALCPHSHHRKKWLRNAERHCGQRSGQECGQHYGQGCFERVLRREQPFRRRRQVGARDCLTIQKEE